MLPTRLMLPLLTLLMLVSASANAATTLTLAVDATEAPRYLLHAHEVIPAQAGALTLLYPKWIPGEHAPNGPIADVANLRLSAGGKPIAWRRDDVDMYAVHVTVPRGVDSIEANFDYLAPPDREGFSNGSTTTSDMLGLEWNLVLLYPAGIGQHDLQVAAKLTLPPGWKWGGALESSRQSGATVEFKPVTLETLVDSPVLAGSHFRSWPLGGTPAHFLDVVADSESALDADDKVIDGYRRLVTESGALFGARHYARYHFLLMLSDHVAHFGLEHHQSSDNRSRERALVSEDERTLFSGLLPHEFVHSWNGKYRRPSGLAVDGFDKPMKGELLWVYEGLTNYLGWVLTGRSNLITNDQLREELAATAAMLDNRPGRAWRPLVDTAVAAQALYRSPGEWSSTRRSTDYYPEGTLLWLDVDVTIRQKTNGARSIDDFVKRFHGGQSGPAQVNPYSLDDVVAALEAVAPNDWHAFFRTRVDEVAMHPPLGGISNGGWKLVYDDKPNVWEKTGASVTKSQSFPYTLGFTMRENGRVGDVIAGSPAAKAGLAPGMQVLGVNGRKLGRDVFSNAIKEAKSNKAAIEVLATNGEFYRLFKLDYHGGARSPHLVRDGGKADLLSAILKPAQGATPKTAQTSISPTK